MSSTNALLGDAQFGVEGRHDRGENGPELLHASHIVGSRPTLATWVGVIFDGMVTLAPGEGTPATRGEGRRAPSRATTELAVEVSSVRYRSPDGEFAVVDALTREAEGVDEQERSC